MSLKASDRVRVIGGPYLGWEGTVLKVEGNPVQVAVAILAFGKATAIELRSSDVEAIDPGNEPDSYAPAGVPSGPNADNSSTARPEPND